MKVVSKAAGDIKHLEVLSKELKVKRDANKKLKQRLNKMEEADAKQHAEIVSLHERLQKFKAEKDLWEKAIASKLSEPPQKETKKQNDKQLKNLLEQLHRRIRSEELMIKKNLEAAKAELQDCRTKVKEAEQEHNLNTNQLIQLRKSIRHKQLKPLKTKTEPMEEELKSEDSARNNPIGSFFITDINDRDEKFESEEQTKVLNVVIQDNESLGVANEDKNVQVGEAVLDIT
eukprot:TRINITY_DN3212_c0_g3_i1.p1 TRINITY_DN3212_c0_g3~~TRINITY_DN3212_c0_g3_i1.p1  ORF type:complete len:238 (+),score=70.70 TRINITY_DN3212_c0_g3_i1:23-715(+)